MKNKLTTALATLLILVLCLTSDSSIAQTKTKSATMKECCMMKDGKMMHMKNGQMIPMEKDMTMKNGTICKANGECVMKDGKVIKMREGECMDMMGNMENCSMTTDHSKHTTKKVTRKKSQATSYTCPMHPDVISDKAGTCPTCGMDLVVKK